MPARKKATAKRPAAKKPTQRKKRPAKKKTPVKKKTATNKKRGGGRPSKFKPEFERLVMAMAELGATDEQMAKALEVTERTFNNWKKSKPEFFHSLKTAKQVADEAVERSLFQRATGYSHPEEKIFCDKGDIVRAETVKHFAPDTTACIFWLKNRRPDDWRDKVETEHSGSIAAGMSIGTSMSEKDWLKAAKRQQEIMKQGISE